jgi:hypothetical protein
MSDPKHFDHILPFLQPADVHHAIPLTAQEVLRMHAKDDVPVAESNCGRLRAAALLHLTFGGAVPASCGFFFHEA